MRTLTLLALLTLVAYCSSAITQEPKQEPKKDLMPILPIDLKRKDPIEYGADIEPIFRAKCYVCHTGNVTEGKFDMSTHANVMKGGSKRGSKIIVPGKASESFLFLACTRQVKPIMPPKTEEPLNQKEVSLIKLWIEEGAKAPTTIRVKEKVVVNLPPALVKPVRAVAVSPDGKTVAASRGNQIHIYDGKKGDYIKTLVDSTLKTPDGKEAKAAHISLVESMAFSPDGKTLASGSFQELTLWDAEKYEPKQRISGFADKVTCIAYSADGKFFATGGGAPTEDGEIKVFDAAGKLVTEIKNGHSDTVFAVAFSPDGKLLATGAADKFVKVFELPKEAGQQAKFVKSFEGHTHHVMGVGWTPDGKKIASCGADNFVKVWDYEKGEKIRDMQGHTKQVTTLYFVGKTAQFVTGSGDASVRMWNAENGGNVRTFPGAADFVYAVATSTDGTVVASGCEDGLVRVYNGANGSLVKAALPPDAEPKKDEKKEEPKKK
jgi:WD40 repeat protein